MHATLEALRALEQSGRTAAVRIVVFQPHLYSRTKAFAAEFGRALAAADEVFVLDVYGAREQPLAGISGASVAEHVSCAGALRPRLLRGRRAGRGRPPAGRRHRHDGCGRRDPAGAGDRDGACGAGEPRRAGPARDPRERARRQPDRRTAERLRRERRHRAISRRRSGRSGRGGQPSAQPKTRSRGRAGAPGGNARSAAPRRPAPWPSRRPAARRSARSAGASCQRAQTRARALFGA